MVEEKDLRQKGKKKGDKKREMEGRRHGKGKVEIEEEERLDA